MPDHAVVADDRVLERRGVDDAPVLDRRPGTDRDPPVVAAQHGLGPDGRPGADGDVADDGGIGMDVRIRMDVGAEVAERVERHGLTLQAMLRVAEH